MSTTKEMVHLKVWGDWACFTRPEMKVERVSYPVITPSAARGVLEAIFWEPQLYYIVSSVHILKRGAWSSIRRNEIQDTISPRSAYQWRTDSKAISYVSAGGGSKDGTQRNMLALRDVAYVISAELRTSALATRSIDTCKKYLSEFKRRAQKGKCFHRPGLGMREFAADFQWVDQPHDEHQRYGSPAINEDLGIMLYDVFSPKKRQHGFIWNGPESSSKSAYTGTLLKPSSCYFKAAIKDSVLDCHPDSVEMIYPPDES